MGEISNCVSHTHKNTHKHMQTRNGTKVAEGVIRSSNTDNFRHTFSKMTSKNRCKSETSRSKVLNKRQPLLCPLVQQLEGHK